MLRSRTKWVRYFSRGQHPLLLADSVMLAHREFSRYFSLPPMQHWARHSGSLFLDRRELARMLRTLGLRVYSRWTEEMIGKMSRDLKRFVRTCRLAGKQSRIVSFERVFAKMVPAWQTMYFPIFMGDAVTKELRTQLKPYGEVLAGKVFKLASKPLYPTNQQKYERALRHFKLGQIAPEAIVTRFSWIRTYLLSVHPLTIRDVLRDAKSLPQAARAPQKLRLVRLSKRVTRLIRLARLLAWFRDWRLGEIAKAYTYLYPVLRLRARELKLSYVELCQLHVHELLTGKVDRRSLRARLQGYGIEMNRSEITVVTGAVYQAMKRRIGDKDERRGVANGVCASPGVVIGRVRLVDAYSYYLLRPGDIAVCAELTPLANPYVRGLRAIVTDEGGVTSHAAVIAREYGIPCLIGTGNATSSLRTGDLIKVDATQGSVRALNKSRL